MALPTLTRTIDDDFVNSWYEIRPEAIDNILESNVFTLALKEHGCFVPQVGGEYVTRTIGYGTKTSRAMSQGSVLTQSVPKLDTMARWEWRYFYTDVNRDPITTAKNSGKFKIKDYLKRRIEAAKEGLSAGLETDLFRWGAYTEAPYHINGIYDVAAPYTAESAVGDGSVSGTYATGSSNGNVSRTNTWWRNWATNASSTEAIANKIGAPTVAPYSLNLTPDMRHFFNLVSANQKSPDFIICDQDIYETYEDELTDKIQIVRTAFDQKAADLGFSTMTFKGATFTYSSKLASSKHIFMLNLNDIEFPYEPNLWFDMTDWKDTPKQLEQVAYIVSMSPGLITDEPRRHGHMEYSS